MDSSTHPKRSRSAGDDFLLNQLGKKPAVASLLIASLALAYPLAAADTYVAKSADYDPVNPTDGAAVTWNGSNGGPVTGLTFGTNAFTSIQNAIDGALPGDTVHIAAGSYTEGTEITVSKSLTIQGDGATATTISGGDSHRVFNIENGAYDVVFEDLTISNGKTSGATPFDRSGGGIRSASTGLLTVVDSTITGNSALVFDLFTGGSGGGISASGNVSIANSTVSGNVADIGGAGISSSGDVAVRNSTVTGNVLEFGRGGGINCTGSLLVVNTTLSWNSVADSGGAIISDSDITVINSVFFKNSAFWAGGGIANYSTGNVMVINSTFSDNQGENGGGGAIYNISSGSVTVTSSTLAHNSAPFGGKGGGIYNFSTGGVVVNNSIVAGNQGIDPDVAGGSYSSNGANFIGTDTSTDTIFTTSGDKTFANTSATVIDDIILPLADNGGPTMTHALAAGNPAANMGKNADIPADSEDLDGDSDTVEPTPVDQRGIGYARIRGAIVDIGAFESDQLTTPVLDLSVQDAIYTGTTFGGASTSITGSAGDIDPTEIVLEYFSVDDPSPPNAIVTPKNVGAYWVRAAFSGNANNHPVTTDLQRFQITPATLAATVTATNKVYDTTTAAVVVVALDGVLGNDTVTGSANGTFSDKNVGTDKAVTIGTVTLAGPDSGNYSIPSAADTTADITMATLSATATAANKIYDATDTATVSITLGGVLGSDAVTGSATGTFSDKNVGAGKNVIVGTVALEGIDAGNYNVAAAADTSASITAATLSAAAAAANKVYDATDAATVTIVLSGLFDGDDVVGSATGSFDDKNVGTGKSVTIDKLTLAGNDADNYTATTVGSTTADIEPATLSATATAASKIYDGTTAAAVTIALSGLLSGDVVVGSATGTFDDESVGNGKTVTIGTVTLSGTDAANYTVTSAATTTADIVAPFAGNASIRATPNGFLLTFQGIPGNWYLIQHTNNFIDPWNVLVGPILATSTGLIVHEDLISSTPSQRYYRLVPSSLE